MFGLINFVEKSKSHTNSQFISPSARKQFSQSVMQSDTVSLVSLSPFCFDFSRPDWYKCSNNSLETQRSPTKKVIHERPICCL